MILRCQALRHGGSAIKDGYEDMRRRFNSTLSGIFFGDEYVRHFSMNCGTGCFRPRVTEHDLMVGRVCERPNKGRCRGAAVSIDLGGAESSSSYGIGALFAILGILVGVASGLAIAYV